MAGSPTAVPTRARILFFGEGVTLAHVTRPAVLAGALDPDRYACAFACDPAYRPLIGHDLVPEWFALESIPSATFLQRLQKGQPLYDSATLRRYALQDLAIIDAFRPQLIVGDFRLSLSVSARVAGVPFATVTNGYWSPYATSGFPVPELPMNRILGTRLAQVLFTCARPAAFALHTRPLNAIRREFGLPSLGLDLRRVYADADYPLYADPPGLYPMALLPDTHTHLGPIIWSPASGMPDWWGKLEDDRPILYVTLGSSGQAELLPGILCALAELHVSVIAATAGRTHVAAPPDNARVAAYLPGPEAARRSSIVICNGGSPTTQQAIDAGVPVIGIASNLDQFLNMQALEAAGAGITLRASEASTVAVRSAVQRILATDSYRTAARALQARFAAFDAKARFAAFVDSALRSSAGAGDRSTL